MSTLGLVAICAALLSSVGIAACGDDGGEGTGAGGAGGASTGSTGGAVSGCADLTEEVCDAEPDCRTVFGTPLAGGDVVYAGCASTCSAGGICSGPDTSVCASEPSGACWDFASPIIPDGWELLSEVNPCSEACGE